MFSYTEEVVPLVDVACGDTVYYIEKAIYKKADWIESRGIINLSVNYICEESDFYHEFIILCVSLFPLVIVANMGPGEYVYTSVS